MPSQDRLQQFNLANFYGSVLIPSITAVSKAFDSAVPLSIDYAISAFFEMYWWLSLGVQLDYFPERQANVMLARHLADRHAYHDLLARHSDLFPGELITSLETALRAGRFFEEMDNYFFYSPEVLRGPFQVLLAMATDFALNPFVIYFTSVINFGSQEVVGKDNFLRI